MRTLFEKILVSLDVGAPGALLRIVLGILLVPAVEVVDPKAGLWMTSAFLLVLLFAIKSIAAITRRLVRASPSVLSQWEWRRNVARYYDSYQWRKLLWFGIGITIGGALGWPGTRTQWGLGVVCLAAGGAGELLWRRHKLSLAEAAA